MRCAIVLALLLAPAVARADAPAPSPSSPSPLEPKEGVASAATAAGSSGVAVRPGVEVIADYDLHVARDGGGYEWFHQFDLQRAHASLDGVYGAARARFVAEAVRSASEGALLGVAGDSLVLRVREASAGAKVFEVLAIDGGVVPTLTISELDGSFALRAVAATPLESTGLGSPADLGATARVTLPRGAGFVAAGVYNGEGYTGRELNRGKNTEVAVELHPAPRTLPAVALFASAQIGSAGVGGARQHRATAAGLFQGKRIRAGVAFTYAWGIGEDGDARSWLVDGFVRTEPIDRLIFGARAFWWTRDARVAANGVGEATVAGGYRIAAPLEAFLSVTRAFPESTAGAALPSVDAWDGRVIAHVVF